jgi:hypothetical protein
VGRARRTADEEAGAQAEKVCTTCGRRITWRAKWARDWHQVRYCSDACRRRGLGPDDNALETAIRDLLATRAAAATICPSEAARKVALERGSGGDEAWRSLMEPARMAARRLVDRGEVEILQRGRVVDPSTAKGPVRIRRARLEVDESIAPRPEEEAADVQRGTREDEPR